MSEDIMNFLVDHTTFYQDPSFPATSAQVLSSIQTIPPTQTIQAAQVLSPTQTVQTFGNVTPIIKPNRILTPSQAANVSQVGGGKKRKLPIDPTAPPNVNFARTPVLQSLLGRAETDRKRPRLEGGEATQTTNSHSSTRGLASKKPSPTASTSTQYTSEGKENLLFSKWYVDCQ